MKLLKILALLALLTGKNVYAETKFSDPQIAAVVVSANQVDVDAGNLALKQTSNTDVKKFAEKMVTDHTSVNKQAVALVTKLKVKPEENDTSSKLSADGKKTLDSLSKLSGSEFDKAYVDNEVAYHEAVIGVVKDSLVPSASNEELKALLVKSSPVFVEHLQHAKSLQAKLNSK